MINIREVWEGWRNRLMPPKDLKQMIENTAEGRISICKACKHYSPNDPEANKWRPDIHCTKCGCPLESKTRCLSCACPLGKWGEVVSNEDDIEIEKLLSDDGS